jgi:peptidoglycan/LPS O-acetylase OafA/YrhL
VRIPSLDGLRAVSILLVVLAHLAGTGQASALAWLGAVGDVGNLGVRTFFVISGFLMTMLLEGEYERSGRISLSGFLQRRAFRILPALWAYLVALVVMTATGIVAVTGSDLLTAGTFAMNYDAQRSWYVGHLWSLSVEAQFYVLWAAIRVLVGRSRMLPVALAALAVGPAARVGIHLLAPEWRWSIGEAFPTVVDALATGSLLAMLHPRLVASAQYLRVIRSHAAAAMPLGLLALNAARPYIAFSYTIGETLMNLLLAATIHRTVMFPGAGVGRVLNARAVAALGTLSYSLYLWQQPFLNRQSTAVFAPFPLNLVLALFAALLSYWVVERPALQVGACRIKRQARSTHQESNRLHAHVATT